MYCKKVCCGHFEQDNDVDFVDSQIRRSKDGVFRSLLLWSTRSNLKEKLVALNCQNDNYKEVLTSTFHSSVSFHESPLTCNRLIHLLGKCSCQNSPIATTIAI